MYGWIWRTLPGGLPGKLVGCTLLLAAAVALLFLVVFPAVFLVFLLAFQAVFLVSQLTSWADLPQTYLALFLAF